MYPYPRLPPQDPHEPQPSIPPADAWPAEAASTRIAAPKRTLIARRVFMIYFLQESIERASAPNTRRELSSNVQDIGKAASLRCRLVDAGRIGVLRAESPGDDDGRRSIFPARQTVATHIVNECLNCAPRDNRSQIQNFDGRSFSEPGLAGFRFKIEDVARLASKP
jgi:hypothetical protein